MSKTITEIARVIDCLHSTPKYSEKGFPMVRVENVKNSFLDLRECFLVDEQTCNFHNKNHVPQKGDIIITRVGSFGMMALVDTNEKFCLGQNIAVIVPNSHGKFLYYYLQSPFIQKFIFGNSGGSSYKSLSLERIRALPLRIDNLNISAIEKLLYEIDSKISCNNSICDELESMAKTVFDYWFMQYNFPDKNNRPYRSSGGKMVYNEFLKREIPDGWEAIYMSRIVDTKKRGDWGSDTETAENNMQVACIRGADMDALRHGPTVTSTKRYISNRHKNRALEYGDFVIEISGTPGRSVYINNGLLSQFDHPLISSNFCQIVSLREKHMLYWFSSLWDGLYKAGAADHFSGQTTMKNLQFDIMANSTRIALPDETVLKKYHEKMSTIYEYIQLLYAENGRLISLRDWLLPMLMNGQIKVGD